MGLCNQFEAAFENTHQKKSNKCKKYDFSSFYTNSGHARHIWKHTVGKGQNKCKQCKYTSSQPCNLKISSWEKV